MERVLKHTSKERIKIKTKEKSNTLIYFHSHLGNKSSKAEMWTMHVRVRVSTIVLNTLLQNASECIYLKRHTCTNTHSEDP